MEKEKKRRFSLFLFYMTMISKNKIRKSAEDKVKELGGYLVDVKVSLNNIITIYFDKIEGVSFEDCKKLSRYIEEVFDRDIEDYTLNVCSAGLDSTFKVDQQYHKNIGKEVGVLLLNGKRKRGVIISYDDNLILETRKKKKGARKEYIKEHILIKKEEIKETKLKLNFI